jgi:hypothetical protein
MISLGAFGVGFLAVLSCIFLEKIPCVFVKRFSFCENDNNSTY